MSLKDLFFIFRKNDYERELKKKLFFLKKNIDDLKKQLETLQEKNPSDYVKQTNDPPIIIEKINIEKIILDKYELNNNFGQLGIKELKGRLNIGATYGSEFFPNLKEKDKECSNEENKKADLNNTPKVNIHAKKED